jgi:hypothetical protein
MQASVGVVGDHSTMKRGHLDCCALGLGCMVSNAFVDTAAS